jgi:pimeloyl-ACP methyl ester carboxylesterase
MSFSRRNTPLLGLVLLTGLLALAVSTSGLPAAASNAPTPTPLPVISSGLVDIGEYALFIDCQGEGSPTVILDAGMGMDGRTWLHVQPKIARFTRVCSYDRAGLGGSDPSPVKPHTAQVMADELYALLTQTGIEGPYVLVAHSFAGYVDRLFAASYPEMVVGMVLVDTPHEDQGYGTTLDAYGPEDAAWDNREGVTVAEWDASRAEVRATRSADDETPELGDRPLVVLSVSAPIFAGEDTTEEQVARWEELQADLSTLSSNSSSIRVADSGHLVQNDQPNVVIDAVRQVVEAVRAAE